MTIETAFEQCKEVFVSKLQQYGTSFNAYHTHSITDKLLNIVEALRVKVSKENLQGIVNYGLIGLMLLDNPNATEAVQMYEKHVSKVRSIMDKRNEQYHYAWKKRRLLYFIDEIEVKLLRCLELEKNKPAMYQNIVIDNYTDLINYAIFAIVKLESK